MPRGAKSVFGRVESARAPKPYSDLELGHSWPLGPWAFLQLLPIKQIPKRLSSWWVSGDDGGISNSKVFHELLPGHGPTVHDTRPALGGLPFSVGLLAAASHGDGSCWVPVLVAMGHTHSNCTNLQTSQVLWHLRVHPELRPPLAAMRNELLQNIFLNLQNCLHCYYYYDR